MNPAMSDAAFPSLAGRRILVTRAPHQAQELSRLLRQHAAIPVEVPVLTIAPPEDFASLDAALHTLLAQKHPPFHAGFDWIVFTSANAVRALVARAAALGLPPLAVGAGPSIASSQSPSIAAIGRSTAAAAQAAGFAVSLVPGQAVGESLAAALAPHVADRRVLLVRAAVARDVLPDALRAAGATLTLAEAYRNLVPDASVPLLRQATEQGIDAATFTSSSSVVHLAALAAEAALPFPLPGVPAISIGPITSATLREQGWPPAAEAATADIPSLVAAVCSQFL